MAKIYDKVTNSTDFPTDKSLILESKDAYHVPFTFGSIRPRIHCWAVKKLA
jgi:hypothetical protein